MHQEQPSRIVSDLDATDDPLHGDQLGKFLHGYYQCYCYLPLYIFYGGHLLCAQLRPAELDASSGVAAGAAAALDLAVRAHRAAGRQRLLP